MERVARRIAKVVMVRVTVALALGLGFAVAAAADPGEYVRVDPAAIKSAEVCGECHVNEFEVWRTTTHATGFKTLHRKASAEAIAERMGFRLIKRDSLCIRCHYTPKVDDGEIRARSGVSCESCHGAGRDWIDVHNDYGPGADASTESPEHRAMRIEESRELGMRRPSDIYGVAANCFGCHTVPEERLVNVGGHSTGTASFELVERVEGEIRHNFLDSLLGGAVANRTDSEERKRLLYVTGRALDLEYSLRGMAEASETGLYAKAMNRRVRSAVGELRAIARAADLDEVDEMLEIVRGVDVVPANREALVAAADTIGTRTRRILDRVDPTQLASLDPLVQGLAEPLSDALEVAENEPGTVGSVASTAAVATPVTTDDGGPTASAAPTSTRRRGARPAVGDKRSHIRPRSSHATIGASACSGCHAPQNEWWFGDEHFSSTDAFFAGDPKALRIATLYGLDATEMTLGTVLCMDCHGTVVTGKERREVLDGVSCESCHGAAKDYLEPHQVGEKSLGDQRPGYRDGLRLGMVELQALERRAETCAGCHYITDPRLISSGHPSGSEYDFAEAMRGVRHWEAPLASDGELRAAFGQAQAARGPVPTVELASLGEEVEVAATGTSAGGASRASRSSEPDRPTRARVLGPRPLGTTGGATAVPAGSVELPPFPDVDESDSIEDLLLISKERLEALYRAVAEAKDDD